jgi:hypothetical protein
MNPSSIIGIEREQGQDQLSLTNDKFRQTARQAVDDISFDGTSVRSPRRPGSSNPALS